MSKPIALFDLDDTLFDFKNELYSAIRDRTGHDVHWSNWTTYDLTKSYPGLQYPEMIQAWIDEGIIERAKPLQHAKRVVDYFKSIGYGILAVSRRS